MINDKTATQRNLSVGDQAVSGLVGGLLGGVLMGIILVGAGVLYGDSLVQAVERFDPFTTGVPLQGVLLHLGVATFYGIIYGLLQALLPRRIPGWLSGLAYGLLLFGLAEYLIIPGSGIGLEGLPTPALLAAHGLYGLVLGLHGER